jgi:hypothetical protein
VITQNLHTNPQPLDRDAHRALRVRLPVTDWGVAGRLNAIFIAAVEFGDVAIEYPIVFVRAGEENGKPLVAPVAVLGVAQEQNLYLDGAAWHARYIPAVVRAYPFAIGRVDTERFAICVDMGWSGIDSSQGEPLFQADGQPTELLSGMQKHLETLEAEAQRTRAVCSRLFDLDLLRDMRFDAELPGGRKHTVDGFMTIDEERMKQLDDATLAAVQRGGLLGLIHAHWLSMRHMQLLLQRHAARLPAPAVAANGAA